MVGMVLLISCACLCGITLIAVYGRCDPLKQGLIERSDQLMPYFVMDKLQGFPGVPGLFVACVFSASLSTLSSGFNALSTVTWDDFLRHTSLAQMSERRIKLLCKVIGAMYGMLSILMAFFVGLVGNVLQAAISLAGALFGPLFGLYILALLCPLANTVGVITGLLTGQTFTIWMLIGSLMYPKAADQYPTYTDECVNFHSSNNSTNESVITGSDESVIQSMYHMAFLLVPISGFVISLIVGFAVSLATGGAKDIGRTDPEHLSAITWFLWPSSLVPVKDRITNFDEMADRSAASPTVFFNNNSHIDPEVSILSLNQKEKPIVS